MSYCAAEELTTAQKIANALRKPVAIGETIPDGDCMFESIVVLFREAALMHCSMHLSIAMLRKAVADKFTPQHYANSQTFRDMIDMWKLGYDQAVFTKDEEGHHEYGFMVTAARYLPASSYTRQLLKDKQAEFHKGPLGPPLRRVVNEIDELSRLIEWQDNHADIERAMHILREAVIPDRKRFWGEEYSMSVILTMLEECFQRPVVVFVLSFSVKHPGRVECNARESPTASETPKDCIFAFVFFNHKKVHYQPLRVDGRLVMTFRYLPAFVCAHWKSVTSSERTESRREEAKLPR